MALIFWETEYAFYLIYDVNFIRYVGGVIWLAVVFYINYQLDKKYIFLNRISEVRQ